MPPRKTPYEHTVGSHIRSGIQVSKYTRGKGAKPKKPRKIIKSPNERKNFNVTVDGKTYPINAATFSSALNIGLSKTTIIPTRIKIRRMKK